LQPFESHEVSERYVPGDRRGSPDKYRIRKKSHFSGKVEIFTTGGTGLFIVKEGEVIAACYHEDGRELLGNEAFTYLKESMEKMSSSPRFVQYRYGPEELALAEELSIEEGLSLMKEGATKRMPQARLDDEELARLLKLPGVRAVLTSFEGFPVQNVGEGDFEQIAAMGEDLIRSAGKVAGDIDLGCPESVTLEGTEGICVIARYGDLSLCVVAERGSHLGLIRLAIGTLRKETSRGT